MNATAYCSLQLLPILSPNYYLFYFLSHLPCSSRYVVRTFLSSYCLIFFPSFFLIHILFSLFSLAFLFCHLFPRLSILSILPSVLMILLSNINSSIHTINNLLMFILYRIFHFCVVYLCID